MSADGIQNDGVLEQVIHNTARMLWLNAANKLPYEVSVLSEGEGGGLGAEGVAGSGGLRVGNECRRRPVLLPVLPGPRAIHVARRG